MLTSLVKASWDHAINVEVFLLHPLLPFYLHHSSHKLGSLWNKRTFFLPVMLTVQAAERPYPGFRSYEKGGIIPATYNCCEI